MKTVGLYSSRLSVGNERIWNFTRDIQVNDEGVMAMASTNGSPVEDDDCTRLAGFSLHLNGAGMSVEPTVDDDGFIVLCTGDDAVEALKQAISHLYRVIVKEKVDIREVEAIDGIRRKKT